MRFVNINDATKHLPAFIASSKTNSILGEQEILRSNDGSLWSYHNIYISNDNAIDIKEKDICNWKNSIIPEWRGYFTPAPYVHTSYPQGAIVTPTSTKANGCYYIATIALHDITTLGTPGNNEPVTWDPIPGSLTTDTRGTGNPILWKCFNKNNNIFAVTQSNYLLMSPDGGYTWCYIITLSSTNTLTMAVLNTKNSSISKCHAGNFVPGKTYTVTKSLGSSSAQWNACGATCVGPALPYIGQIFVAAGSAPWGNGDGEAIYTELVTAGNFIIGETYTIKDLGNTTWTDCGADSDTIGLSFKATNVGSGTGVAGYFPNESITKVITSKTNIDGFIYTYELGIGGHAAQHSGSAFTQYNEVDITNIGTPIPFWMEQNNSSDKFVLLATSATASVSTSTQIYVHNSNVIFEEVKQIFALPVGIVGMDGIAAPFTGVNINGFTTTKLNDRPIIRQLGNSNQYYTFLQNKSTVYKEQYVLRFNIQ